MFVFVFVFIGSSGSSVWRTWHSRLLSTTGDATKPRKKSFNCLSFFIYFIDTAAANWSSLYLFLIKQFFPFTLSHFRQEGSIKLSALQNACITFRHEATKTFDSNLTTMSCSAIQNCLSESIYCTYITCPGEFFLRQGTSPQYQYCYLDLVIWYCHYLSVQPIQ